MPSPQHAKDYLQRADSIPHRREGEATLLEFLPAQLGRFLDLGAGGGRLLSFVKSARPASVGVALDFSPTMLRVLRDTFGSEPGITIIGHDLDRTLPELCRFDAVVSSFAIHHVSHAQKFPVRRNLCPTEPRESSLTWSMLPRQTIPCTSDFSMRSATQSRQRIPRTSSLISRFSLHVCVRSDS